MTDQDHDATAQFYAANAQSYTDSTRHDTNPHLAPFLARLGAEARILELGCGAGRDALALRQAGHDVDATDGVPEIAAQAALLLRQPVRVLRFEDLDDIARYDAVWANASLLHLPRARLPDILARIWTSLKPDGLHFATYKSGTGEALNGMAGSTTSPV
jgi:SAM-dependent methyltransferase